MGAGVGANFWSSVVLSGGLHGPPIAAERPSAADSSAVGAGVGAYLSISTVSPPAPAVAVCERPGSCTDWDQALSASEGCALISGRIAAALLGDGLGFAL